MITKDDVIKVAKLAKLRFTESETESLTIEMNNVLGYIDQLKEVDVSNVAPLENINENVEKNVFRSDTPRPSLSREEALKNAPRSADGYFLVPKVLEQEVSIKTPTQPIEEDEEEIF